MIVYADDIAKFPDTLSDLISNFLSSDKKITGLGVNTDTVTLYQNGMEITRKLLK